ncbi:complement C3-like [Haliotis rufescens]|uniref:complement C3-like n=1 Tax=Haliotis rufescens TaxID=6454 RepID=UPI00201F5E4A|nr:complement C3-like [Haliotis rufescens]
MAATAIDLLAVVWMGTFAASVHVPEPMVLTVAPKHVRFHQSTTMMCSATGVGGGGLNVTLKVRDESCKSSFFKQTLFFQTDGIQSVTFNMTTRDVTPTSQYLVLETEGPWVREDMIPIQRDTGYIMVHTDKPTYTPSQTVKYRVVALGEDLAWAPWTVQVDVVSPNGIIVDQIPNLDATAAFSTREFHLHEHGMLGRWQVRASFHREVQLTTAAAATFVVDEYVLPTFSVKTQVRPAAITQDTKQIRIIMIATYVFGERIRGEGQLRLGVKQGDVVQRQTDKLYNVKFKSGRAAISIKTHDLTNLPQWCSDRVSHLYIEANVTESGYGETQTVYHVTTPISKDAWRLTFPSDQHYFLPSRPFLFRGILSDASGVPAPGVKVKVIMADIRHQVSAESAQLMSKRLTTNAEGVFGFTQRMPELDRVSFQVQTIDRRYNTQTTVDHTVQALTPEKPRITLQADVPQGDGDNVAVHVGYTSSVNDSMMTVLVEARGQTIYNHTFVMNGTDLHTFEIPAAYRAELSPLANVLAFFTTRDGTGEPEVISNTMTLDVPDVCLEEVSLRKYNQDGVHRPGFNTRFRIDGTNNTRVGLVAVDLSVYLLAGRSTLSRQEMFQTLAGHSLASPHRAHSDPRTKTWTANGFVLRILDKPIHRDVGTLTIRGLHANSSSITASRKNLQPQKTFETVQFVARQNFSETWLFEDILLSRRILRGDRAIMYLNWTLPDSLTTWRMHAVGVSSRRGVCVSKALDFTVSKEFFVDIHMPYKVVRLETVKVKFSVFNFKAKSIKVTVTVTAPEELCIVREAGRGVAADQKRGGRTLRYTERIKPNSGAWHDYTFVALKPGHHHIRAVARSGRVTDAVQKDMYVVAEGRRVSQTVTFQLDPSALLLHNDTGTADDNMAGTRPGERINTSWSKLEDEQTTVVDLALPHDTIPGTSHTDMFAYGDLMGDVVSGAILQSESLMEETAVLGGRRVLGDLAPAVTALHYLQHQGVITHDLEAKGKQFVKQGVSQLLNYRHPKMGFVLQQGQPPATWFTAAVLQTLCVVKEMNLTFVDQSLIDNGAQWLLGRIGDEIEMTEESPRRTGHTEADDVVTLVAEVLLSMLQCEKHIKKKEFQDVSEMLKVQLWAFLEERLDNISSSLALTKVSLALTKVNSEYAHVAVRSVINSRRNSPLGFYWSDTGPEVEESTMFKDQVEAQWVEATSFALMTLLHSGTWSDVTPVANWLVHHRGRHGVFVGMMDTMAATNALAMYSHRRQSPDSDLHCNITSHQSQTYHQTIDFSQQEAVVKKGVSGAPSGEVYQFDSRGSRLGQMQIETTYNVAVGKNDHCTYNLSVSSEPFDISSTETTLCKQCGFACPHDTEGESSRRKRSPVASANIMCVEVCLQSLTNTSRHNVRVDAGIPSGHKIIPVTQAEMAIMTRRKTMYLYKNGLFSVMLEEVAEGEEICFGFRTLDKQEVAHHQPSVVTIREERQREPSCSRAYDAKDSSVTLPVLCSDLSQRHKGVCICASGTCGKCLPRRRHKMRTKHVRRQLCGVDYVYKIESRGTEAEGAWRHTETTVLETHIQGRDRVKVGQTLTFSTPGYCTVCPNYRVGQAVYVLGRDGDRLRDDSGTVIFRHVVDDSVVFLNVTTTRVKKRVSAVKESFVKRAINYYRRRGCLGSK